MSLKQPTVERVQYYVTLNKWSRVRCSETRALPLNHPDILDMRCRKNTPVCFD